jgi:hypothetical protein
MEAETGPKKGGRKMKNIDKSAQPFRFDTS